MNSNFLYETSEEEYISNISQSIGQQSPKIKPKLDDTIPSILNLSSDISTSKKTSKDDSYNFDSSIGKNFSSNKIISLFSKNSIFIPKHCKAFSNEVFGFTKRFNFYGKNFEEEKNKEDSNDNFDYNYGNELNFGIRNFCEEKSQTEIEEVKKIILVENMNDVEDDEENEGLNILNMLRKSKNKN